jgi:hypothetical protein
MVQTLDQAGPIWFGPSKQIVFNGVQLDPRDVIQFISPMQSFNSAGARAVETALRIEESRLRASQSVLPSGYLKQTGGEPLSSAELNDLAQQFNIARTSGNNTAALNEFIEYVANRRNPRQNDDDRVRRLLGSRPRPLPWCPLVLAVRINWRVLLPIQPAI